MVGAVIHEFSSDTVPNTKPSGPGSDGGFRNLLAEMRWCFAKRPLAARSADPAIADADLHRFRGRRSDILRHLRHPPVLADRPSRLVEAGAPATGALPEPDRCATNTASPEMAGLTASGAASAANWGLPLAR